MISGKISWHLHVELSMQLFIVAFSVLEEAQLHHGKAGVPNLHREGRISVVPALAQLTGILLAVCPSLTSCLAYIKVK